MNLIASPTTKIYGDIICPPDKSITQRALLLGALQNKDFKIINPLLGADPISTATALKELGANIDISNEIVFSENNQGLSSPVNPLDLGNSGTGLRLLIGMVAGLGLNAVFIGDASLSSRPMKRIIDPLSDFGAVFQHDGFTLPIKTVPSLLNRSFNYNMPIASAQVKSSILLAALAAGSEVIINETIQTRNHTEIMLRDFGVNIEVHSSSKGNEIYLPSNEQLKKNEYDVPGDISSAAFLIAAALLAKESHLVIANVGLNPSRTGFLDVIREMNANIEVKDQKEINGELRGTLVIKSSELSAINLGGAIIPNIIDEIPIISVLAAFAKGVTTIQDAGELRKKESDRITAVTEGLMQIGASVDETQDGLIISGGNLRTQESITINSFHDHRIAMSFLVSAIGLGTKVKVLNTDNIATSFHNFVDLAYQIGFNLREL